jgi:hypothetical protein
VTDVEGAGYRGCSRWLLCSLLLLHGCATASERAPQATGDRVSSLVDRLLEHSAVESIVSARSSTFTRRVALMAEDLTDDELERLVPAVRAAFAPELLREDIATHVVGSGSAGFIEDVVVWLETGATAELARLTDAYEPPLTLEEFVSAFLEDPPPRTRVDLMIDWAEVQGAGEFYVLLDEALSEAAHAVVGQLRPDTPAFAPLDGPELQAQLERSRRAALISFLHGYETVPEDVIRRATEEYRSESGRWYVETYTLAVAEAMRAAGQRVVAALGG